MMKEGLNTITLPPKYVVDDEAFNTITLPLTMLLMMKEALNTITLPPKYIVCSLLYMRVMIDIHKIEYSLLALLCSVFLCMCHLQFYIMIYEYLSDVNLYHLNIFYFMFVNSSWWTTYYKCAPVFPQ